MAKIANSVPLGGFIAPNDSADTYATHDEQYGRGGFRSVATTTERDAIPADRRKNRTFGNAAKSWFRAYR